MNRPALFYLAVAALVSLGLAILLLLKEPEHFRYEPSYYRTDEAKREAARFSGN